MWNELKKAVKGWNTLDIESYIETYGFYVCSRTDFCVYALDPCGYGEYFYR